MPKFEAAIINEEVAEAARRGQRHRDFDEGWGDTRYIEVVANDLEQARRKMIVRYPPERGFAIMSIHEVKE
jgi:hypothetical protein